MKRGDVSRAAIFIFILWAFDIVLISGGLISEGRFPRKKCFLFGLLPKHQPKNLRIFVLEKRKK